MSSASQSQSHGRGGGVTVEASRKRKEREVSFDALKKASTSPSPSASASSSANNKAEPKSWSVTGGAGDNRLLAGYLAHEFLTKGTLLGQKWGDPAGAEAAPVVPRKGRGGGAGGDVEGGERYAEVAKLMKSEGTHVQGIVNPTQLATWLQM